MNTNYTDAKTVNKLKYTEIFLYAHIILAKIKDRDRKLKWAWSYPIIHAKYGYHPLDFAKEPRKLKSKTSIPIGNQITEVWAACCDFVIFKK